MAKNIVIAIDGPAGSGKSTLASLVAKELGYVYLDTGAMYRAVTYLAIKNKVINDSSAIIDLVKKSKIELKYENGINKVIANGEDITKEIRTLEVNSFVSEVAKIKEVREELVALQQKIGNEINIVAEGRDTTTTVFPEADLKIFMVASIEARAERRYKENKEKAIAGTLEEIIENLKKRDQIDSGRAVSPLRKADDAIEMDTTNMTIEEEVKFIVSKINEKIK